MRSLVPAMAAIAILASPGDARAEDPLQQCPDILRGVELEVRPISGGVVLHFNSPRPREVAELQTQLREVAWVIEQHSKASVYEPVSAGGRARIPPVDISVTDVGSGARVVIRAQRARDIPELRELAQVLEAVWARSDCSPELRAREHVIRTSLRA